MNKILEVYWRKYNVGNLYLDEEQYYIFKYDIEGVKRAKKHNFEYIIGFRTLEREYKSKALFTFFQNRVPPKNRVDIKQILANIKLKEYDEIEILKRTNGKFITDNYSIR